MKINRRKFLGSAATTSMAFSVVPRHVLGGRNYVAPSEKLTIANIGCGTQGLRELGSLLKNPEIQVTSICDPNAYSTNYVDWSLNGIRNGIRKVLDDASWGEGVEGIPGGRDVMKEYIEQYYAKNKPSGNYTGCNAYADFRELLEKEKDLDAVKVMTPDHLHATISIAAIKKGKHVVIHKPIANRVYESRLLVETAAKKNKVSTHLLAWTKRTGYDIALEWIKDGAIGNLKEIHNWSNRPVWPQWVTAPENTPPIPKGFNWDLWLGPVPDRPYSPKYTNAVFRGWYDFGAGSIADMGHYSLWPLFLTFGFNVKPVSIEAYGTTTCDITNHVSHKVRNTVAFPHSSNIRFKFPSQDGWNPFDLFWYDGGMKPPNPEELAADNKVLPTEGMLFVGDKGKILGGYHCQKPRIIPEKKMNDYMGGDEIPRDTIESGEPVWIDAFKNGKQSPGSFPNADVISETINLGAVALRAGRKIEYDAADMKVTNYDKANQFLTREYRPGWEL